MKINYSKFRSLVRKGYSKSYVRREFKKIPIKQFNEKFNKYVSQESLVNRFNKMRMSTKLKNNNFKHFKTQRARNFYVITYHAKIRNRKYGTVEISTFSLGFDFLITKKRVFELINEQLEFMVQDSPDIEAEFIKVVNMGSKYG